jgi:sulfatase maturation enzyme AslB (radical SAM superfamily)
LRRPSEGGKRSCSPSELTFRWYTLSFSWDRGCCLTLPLSTLAAGAEMKKRQEKAWPVDLRQQAGLLIKNQLENLLQIIDLEKGGHRVFPKGMTMRKHRRPLDEPLEMSGSFLKGKKVKYDTVASYKPAEPRLVMMGNLLYRMLRCVRFDSGPQDVEVDAFRLKNLTYWARYPSQSVIENFGRIAGWCNCDCEFCFLKGTPEEDPKMILSVQEARTRGKYYSPETRIGLPTAHRWNGEPFVNPHIMDILRAARAAQSDHMLEITTNGDFLTEKRIEELAALKPVLVVVSLNSADVETRQRIMKTKSSEVAIKSIPLLRQRGIRFMGSIVTWPSLPLDDVEETARYLDHHQALQIRFLLPGYTRFRSSATLFNTKECWDGAVQLARSLREELRTPIVIQPSYYWNQDIGAVIDGIYRNSPAERAGLRLGDLILEIDGTPIHTKAQAARLLSPTEKTSGIWMRSIKVKRGDEVFKVELKDGSSLEDDFYPYKPSGYPLVRRSRGGIHLIDGFRLEYVKRLRKCVDQHPNARKILVFSTALAKGLFAQAQAIAKDWAEYRLENVDLKVTVAPHNFWGGNIMIGDIHVAQDYIDHLNSLKGEGYRPDLAVIPSSFASRWGFDVLGRSYTEIERRTGVAVHLLPTVRVIV